jgi:hypothetical protein
LFVTFRRRCIIAAVPGRLRLIEQRASGAGREGNQKAKGKRQKAKIILKLLRPTSFEALNVLTEYLPYPHFAFCLLPFDLRLFLELGRFNHFPSLLFDQ